MSNMTKSQLITRLQEQFPFHSAKDVAFAANAILDMMVDALADHRRIEIRGFASFSIRYRKPRVGHNPKTGEKVYLPARVAIHFKPGKALRDQVAAQYGKFPLSNAQGMSAAQDEDEEDA